MRICKEEGCNNPSHEAPHATRGTTYSKRCDTCINLNKYGLTTPQRDALYVEQDGKCAVCYESITFMSARKKIPEGLKRAVVDHCHDSGRVRGLLCSQCNTILGMSYDNKDILSNAITYLEDS